MNKYIVIYTLLNSTSQTHKNPEFSVHISHPAYIHQWSQILQIHHIKLQRKKKKEEENWNKENKEDGTCIFNFVT